MKLIWKWIAVAGVIFLLAGCAGNQIKDNKIYVVKENGQKQSVEPGGQLNTEGVIPFRDNIGLTPDSTTNMVIAVSPDNKIVFLQAPSIVKGKSRTTVIKGDPDTRVDIIKYELPTGERHVIAWDLPFVSTSKWNRDGTMVAFGGGRQLRIYNVATEKFVMQDQMKTNPVTYFGWSPDGKKLYTEHPNLPNASIYYTDSEKFVYAYEAKDDLYFKGVLDQQYYYGTKNFTEGGNFVARTVIADEAGNVVKELTGGRFRDAYQRSLIQVGNEEFGLEYIPDINKPGDARQLTKAFVYDAKFVRGGKVAFITDDGNIEKNGFLLHIADRQGKEIVKLPVSGATMLLLPDGKTGFIGGPGGETVDFVKNELVGKREVGELPLSEHEEIFRTVRGALDTYYRFEMSGVKNQDAAKKYFVDTHDPQQWAYFDLTTMWKERKHPFFMTASDTSLNISLRDLRVEQDKNGPVRTFPVRASLKVESGASNSSGTGVLQTLALELIKRDDRWYVTGFSTFPNSKKALEARQKAEQFVKEAREGRLFDGVLQGKDVKIGQIQFWQMSEPHLAGDVETANFAKVYLQVEEEGNTVVYRMVMDKKNQSYWKPGRLSKGLSGL